MVGIIPVRSLSTEEVLYGDRTTEYRWEILNHIDGDDELVGVLDGVSGGKLKWTQNAAVKGGGNIQVLDLSQSQAGTLRISDVDISSCRLRPVMTINKGSSFPEVAWGTYLISFAREEWDATGRVWSLELLDRCTVPAQDKLEETYSVASGTNILQEVRDILATSGENMSIDESVTVTTSSGLVWPAGTSKLTVINELLDVAGYNSLWVDGWGNFRATPRVLPADRSALYELLKVPRELVYGSRSIYRPDWNRERDSFEVPNKVIAIQAAGGEDDSALTGVWTNEDPESPYSYPSRGRWIVHTIDSVECPEGSDAEIVEFLEARARATLIQMSAVQAEVKVKHLPIPIRVSDVVRFSHDVAGIDTRHVVTNTELEVSSTGLMSTSLQEVISL